VWVASTYFAEGYPYTLVVNLPEILFQQLGASLQAVGLTALFHLPWNLKFLWGPVLDRFETKRAWLVALEIVLGAMLLGLAFFVGSRDLLIASSLAFVVLGFLAASHDIAIDGYYMEALDDAAQSRFVGYRAMAYKAANLVGRGPLVVLVGIIGWGLGFAVAAALLLALALFHAAVLPRAETRRHPLRELVQGLFRRRILMIAATIAVGLALEREVGWAGGAVDGLAAWLRDIPVLGRLGITEWIALGLVLVLLGGLAMLPWTRRRIEGSDSYYARAFVDFLSRERIGSVLAFVMLFRLGESFLQKMRWPFLNAELGMDLRDYGWANGTIGLSASFAATLLGGHLIARHGLRRWVWPFVLAQNLFNLLYVALALFPEGSRPGLALLTAVIAVEEFGAGLGTAVFMVYLMRCCDPAHRAAHFAILSALMSVGFTVAGVASGFLAQAMGFSVYFAFTFVATIPMMVLVWFVPHLDAPRPMR
jgi:PAT family beta-lactamase induction signal transducer AmpG